jgi:hypothetical protein
MDQTNAQRQARFRQRKKEQAAEMEKAFKKAQAELEKQQPSQNEDLRAENISLRQQIAKLQAESKSILISQKQRDPTRLPETPEEWAAARAATTAARKAKRQSPPAEPPDKLQQQIARLQQANREWQTKLRLQETRHKDEIKRISRLREMPKQYVAAIYKAIHPDHYPASREVCETACKVFNAFCGRT